MDFNLLPNQYKRTPIIRLGILVNKLYKKNVSHSLPIFYQQHHLLMSEILLPFVQLVLTFKINSVLNKFLNEIERGTKKGTEN